MHKPGSAPATRRLKMRDLERATGVGREAIRYYIREGLLPEPERPGRNVAWYDESFIERIRLIKELQQKRYLPLQVIKAIVTGDAPPAPHELATFEALEGKLPLPGGEARRAPRRERVVDLAARTGVPIGEIQELAGTEAIAIVADDDGDWVEGAGIRLVELWARFREVGFTVERGFGPETVRLYVDMVRLLAREELRMFSKGLAGRVGQDELVRIATDGIGVSTEFLALLHHATLLRLIAETTPAPRGDDAA